jgi:hypothetical protein
VELLNLNAGSLDLFSRISESTDALREDPQGQGGFNAELGA